MSRCHHPQSEVLGLVGGGSGSGGVLRSQARSVSIGQDRGRTGGCCPSQKPGWDFARLATAFVRSVEAAASPSLVGSVRIVCPQMTKANRRKWFGRHECEEGLEVREGSRRTPPQLLRGAKGGRRGRGLLITCAARVRGSPNGSLLSYGWGIYRILIVNIQGWRCFSGTLYYHTLRSQLLSQFGGKLPVGVMVDSLPCHAPLLTIHVRSRMPRALLPTCRFSTMGS